MLEVVISSRAELSLNNIIDFYVNEYSPERANKVIQSINKEFQNIAKNPRSFSICFDIIEPSDKIRQAIVYSTFKIVFRIQKEKIEILEVFHGKQNPRKLKQRLKE